MGTARKDRAVGRMAWQGRDTGQADLGVSLDVHAIHIIRSSNTRSPHDPVKPLG